MTSQGSNAKAKSLAEQRHPWRTLLVTANCKRQAPGRAISAAPSAYVARTTSRNGASNASASSTSNNHSWKREGNAVWTSRKKGSRLHECVPTEAPSKRPAGSPAAPPCVRERREGRPRALRKAVGSMLGRHVVVMGPET